MIYLSFFFNENTSFKSKRVSNVFKQVVALMNTIIPINRKRQRYIKTLPVQQIGVHVKHNVTVIQHATDTYLTKTQICALWLDVTLEKGLLSSPLKENKTQLALYRVCLLRQCQILSHQNRLLLRESKRQ